MRNSNIEPWAATGPGPADSNEDEHLIARFPNTLRLGPKILEHLGEIAEKPDDVLAPAHRFFAEALVRKPFESWMGEFRERLRIPRVHRLVEAADDLDVVLRHRPRSISRLFANRPFQCEAPLLVQAGVITPRSAPLCTWRSRQPVY